ERVEGEQRQAVPPPAAGGNNTSIVTWKVKVLQTGTFPLRVVSSNGASQAKTISIARPDAEPERRLQVNVSGSFEPGQEVTVHASIPSAGVMVDDPDLALPAGLSRTSGPVVKNTPLPDAKGSLHEATWNVRVEQPGDYPVRVSWEGAAITKKITIVRPDALTPRGGDVPTDLVPRVGARQ